MGSRNLAESAFGSFSDEETPLAEILYADMGILDSLASMLDGQPKLPEAPEPLPEPERRRSPRQRSAYDRQDAGLLIDAQQTSPQPAPKPEQPTPKTPIAALTGDARILAILHELNIPKTKGAVLPSSDRSLLVHLEGPLQYFRKRTYEKVMQRQTDLRLLLEPADTQASQNLASVNLQALGLDAVSIGEDDLSGYADLLGGRTAGSALMAFLPDGPGFILTLRGSKRPFYVPVPKQNLRCRPRRIETLFPGFQLGNWKLLAYFPAAVRHTTGSANAKTAEEVPQKTLLDVVSDQVFKQNEILAACGFPTDRLEPILIYRDVAVAKI